MGNMRVSEANHDHNGGSDAIKQLIPQSAVYISRREAPLMSGDLSLYADEPKTPIRGIFHKRITLKLTFCFKMVNVLVPY